MREGDPRTEPRARVEGDGAPLGGAGGRRPPASEGSVDLAPEDRPDRPVRAGTRPPGGRGAGRSGGRAGGRGSAAPARARGKRFSKLRGLNRVLVLGMIGVVCLLPVISAVRAERAGWAPVGDNALITLRAHDLFQELPTVGQPNSADSLGSETSSSHLGALESYLLAPAVAVAGPRLGVLLTLAVLQAAVLGSGLVMGFRRGGPILLGLLALATVLFIRAVDPSQLHDPINSDVATFALIPLGIAAWSMWDGDLAWTPAFAFLTALVLQPHLSNAPFAIAVTAAGIAGIVVAVRRDWGGRVPRSVLVGIGVTLLLWLPPLCEELFGSGNLGPLARAAGGDRAVVGSGFGLGWVAVAMGPWPLPQFARHTLIYAPNALPGSARLLAGLLVLGVAGAVAVRVQRRGHAAVARWLWIGVGASLVAGFAAGRLPWSGVARTEHVRWMSAIGVLVWVPLAWAGWLQLAPAHRKAFGRPVLIGLSALLALFAVGVAASPPLRQNSGSWYMPRSDPFTDAVAAELPDGTYLLKPVDSMALLTVAPAMALGLDERGYRTYVDDNSLAQGYNDRHRHHGQALDGTIVIMASGSQPPPSGGRLIARSEPAAGLTGDGSRALDAYLVPA